MRNYFFSLAFLSFITVSAQPPVAYNIAYSNKKGTCVYSFATKKEKLVMKAASDPSISADGLKIAYTMNTKNGGRQIAVKEINSGKNCIFNTGNNNSYGPVWSPDGQWIAYNSFDGNTWSIAVMSKDGDKPHVVTQNIPKGLGCYSPMWSADSKKLVVQDMSFVYILSLDGRITKKIAIKKLGNENGISSTSRFILTADEKFLVFDLSVQEPGFEEPPGAIFIHNLETGATSRISPKGIYCFQISLVGESIFFSGSKPRQKDPDICSIGIDGKGMKTELKSCWDYSVRK